MPEYLVDLFLIKRDFLLSWISLISSFEEDYLTSYSEINWYLKFLFIEIYTYENKRT